MGFRDYLIANRVLQAMQQQQQPAAPMGPSPMAPALFASEHSAPGQTLVQTPIFPVARPAQTAPVAPAATGPVMGPLAPVRPVGVPVASDYELQREGMDAKARAIAAYEAILAANGGGLRRPGFDPAKAIAALQPGMNLPPRYGAGSGVQPYLNAAGEVDVPQANIAQPGNVQDPSPDNPLNFGFTDARDALIGGLAKAIQSGSRALPNSLQDVTQEIGHGIHWGAEQLNRPFEWNVGRVGQDVYDMSQGGEPPGLTNPYFYVDANLETFAKDPKNKQDIYDAMHGKGLTDAQGNPLDMDGDGKQDIVGYVSRDKHGNPIAIFEPGGKAVWELYESTQGLLNRGVSSLSMDPFFLLQTAAGGAGKAFGEAARGAEIAQRTAETAAATERGAEGAAAAERAASLGRRATGFGVGREVAEQVAQFPFGLTKPVRKGLGFAIPEVNVPERVANSRFNPFAESNASQSRVAAETAQAELAAKDAATAKRGVGPTGPEEEFGGSKPPGTPPETPPPTPGKYTVKYTDRGKRIGFIEDPEGAKVPGSEFSNGRQASAATKDVTRRNAELAAQPEKSTAVAVLESPNAPQPSTVVDESPKPRFTFQQVGEGKQARWEALTPEGNVHSAITDYEGKPLTGNSRYAQKQAQRYIDRLNLPDTIAENERAGLVHPGYDMGRLDPALTNYDDPHGILKQVYHDLSPTKPAEARVFWDKIKPFYERWQAEEDRLRKLSEPGLREQGATYRQLTDAPRALNDTRFAADLAKAYAEHFPGEKLPTFAFKYGEKLATTDVRNTIEHAVFGATQEEATAARRALYRMGDTPIDGVPARQVAEELRNLREELYGDTSISRGVPRVTQGNLFDAETGQRLANNPEVVRYQFLRNAEGGQAFGTQYELHLVGPDQVDWYAREGGKGEWTKVRTSTPDEARQYFGDPQIHQWSRPVESFDDPEAIRFGQQYDAYNEAGNPPPPAGLPDPYTSPVSAAPEVSEVLVENAPPSAATPEEGVQRYQFRPDTDRGATYGDQYELHPVTPELRSKYHVPTDKNYVLLRRAQLSRAPGQPFDDWGVIAFGDSPNIGDYFGGDDLMQNTLKVSDFSSPEAVSFGKGEVQAPLPPTAPEAEAAPQAAPTPPPQNTVQLTSKYVKPSEVPEAVHGTDAELDRMFNEGDLTRTEYEGLNQTVTNDLGEEETISQMIDRMREDGADDADILQAMVDAKLGTQKYRLRYTSMEQKTGYLIDNKGEIVPGSEFAGADGLKKAKAEVTAKNKVLNTPAGWKRLLRRYDQANMFVKQGQQYNAANAGGFLGDIIGNAANKIAAGRWSLAARDLANVRGRYRLFRDIRAGDPALVRESGSAKSIFANGGSIPDHLLNNSNLSKLDTGNSDRLLLHQGLDKITKNRVVHAPFEVLQSHTVRDARNIAADQFDRLSIYADAYHEELGRALQRFQARMQQAGLDHGFDGETSFLSMQDLGKQRAEDSGAVWWGDFSPDDVKAVTGREDLKRAWKNEQKNVGKYATAEQERALLSYRSKNIDEWTKRLFFFHYWQTRASILHARAIWEMPSLGAVYWRAWQGLENEAQKQGYPKGVQGFLRYMGNSSTGWYGLFDPLGIVLPFTMFRDNSGYDEEKWYDRLFQVSPIIQAAAAMAGSEHFYHPDLTGTSKVRGIVMATINELRAQGHGPMKPVQDPVVSALNSMYTYINDKIGSPKGGYTPTAIDSTQKDQIKSAVYEKAKEQGATQQELTDALIAVDNGAKGNDLAEAAFKDWAAHNLEVKTSGIVIPQGTRLRFGPRDEAMYQASQGYNALDQGQEPTPEQQAGMDQRSLVTAGSPETTQLQTSMDEYNAIGTERQQNLSRGWANIVYGTTQDFDPLSYYIIDGHRISMSQLSQMSEDDRKTLADRWVANNDGTDELDEYRQTRNDYTDAHPEVKDFKDYQDHVRSTDGGARSFRTAAVKDHPEFADELDQKRKQLESDGKSGEVLETELDQWTTSQAAYDAFRGIKHDLYDAAPKPAFSGDQTTVYTQGEGASSDSGSTTGSTRSTGSRLPKPQDIKDDMDEYDQQTAVLNDLVGGDTSQMNSPLVREALTNQYGDLVPTMPKRTRLYLAWAAAQPQGSDTSPEAYVAYLEELKAKQSKGVG